jgi:hypothetical protein
MSDHHTPPQPVLGTGTAYLDGVPIGEGSAHFVGQRPQLTMTGFTGGTHRPCGTCNRPAAVIVNSKTEQPPGGVTLEWEDQTRSVLWVTPHEEGCAEAARPNDPTGKRVTLPPHVIGSQSVELHGARFGDPIGDAVNAAPAHVVLHAARGGIQYGSTSQRAPQDARGDEDAQ